MNIRMLRQINSDLFASCGILSKSTLYVGAALPVYM